MEGLYFVVGEELGDFGVLMENRGNGVEGLEFLGEGGGVERGGTEGMGFVWEVVCFVDNEEVFGAKEAFLGVGGFLHEVLQDEVLGGDEDGDGVHAFACGEEGT